MLRNRLEAFCSDVTPEIFRPVETTNDVWLADPFDVREVHREAREVFEELVEDLSSPSPPAGRILLIQGEAGSGKTHLMRAFRNHVHSQNLAFFGYMQMTTSAPRYDRYILQKLIESLDQPYYPPSQLAPSLRTLSDALVRLLPSAPVEELHECMDDSRAGKLVDEIADALVDRLKLPSIDLHILRALLYLQNERPSVKSRVIKYLRLEPLSEHDCRVLGGMPPRNGDDDPLAVVAQLTAIMHSVLARGLVICVDQFEDMFHLDGVEERFARAMHAVRQLSEIPGTLMVVSCLKAFYAERRKLISQSVLSRLENDPPPVTINAQRTPAEAMEIVSVRLNHLCRAAGVNFDEQSPLDPIAPQAFAQFRRGTIRFLIEDCLSYREMSRELEQAPKRWPYEPGATEPAAPARPDPTHLIQAWNDFRSQPQNVSEDDRVLAALLGRAIVACGEELGAPDAFRAELDAQEPWLRVSFPGVQGTERGILVALCERSAKFGWLKLQIQELEGQAEKEKLVGVVTRSAPFPANPHAQTTQELKRLAAGGGRQVTIQDTDWRCMVALETFRGLHPGAELVEFLRAERPLSMLSSIRNILALDRLTITRPTAARKTGDIIPPQGDIVLGRIMSRTPKDVELDPEDLKRHIAFMGATGSGKTTAALYLIENLLLRKIPAVLVDRKGDLCGYRRPDVWKERSKDKERDELRELLRERIEIAVYTPGKKSGRGLAIPILPRGTRELPADEREPLTQIAADALAGMMGYGNARAAQGKRAALQSALQFLTTEEEQISLDSVVSFVKEKDPTFLDAAGLVARFIDDLAVDLDILARKKRMLFGEGEEPLDAGALFGLDGPGPRDLRKTRLTIVSTKMLSPEDESFWVAQLLMEVRRWFSRHPASHLQAALLLDEADKYLPATNQPVTKQPVEDLLRRARSMGLSVFLASQNPGDFDYRCRDNIRTWLVGLLTQKRGINKLEELFGPHGDTSMLSSQEAGHFHLLAEGKVTRLKMHRNAVDLPSQISDDEIVRLAAAGTRAASDLDR